MPAVQYDYDGYDYIVRKSSTAKKTNVSTPKSSSSSRGYAPQGTKASSTQRSATSSRSVATRSASTRATATTKTTARTATTRVNAKTTSARSNSKVEAVRNANRASVRAIMAENGATTTKRKTTTTAKRKTTSKNLEVPSMLKTKAQKPKEMSLKHAEKVTAPKTKAKSVEKKKESVLKTIAFSMCAFSTLFLICYRSSAINESFNALSGIKAELETANTLNAQLESDIETQTDLSKFI